MQSTWINRVSFLRSGRVKLTLRRGAMGVLASALAVAGLVVFATEASAHNNYFQSVAGACNAPGYGQGATITWTLYNDWNQSETGTFSTTQGVLSTTALSIAASPEENATPTTGAASQTFTQTLTATELAALSPSSTITVNWAATWSDSTYVTGVLSTTVSALNLTGGCATPGSTTPTIATSLVAPSSNTIGNSWGDTATVTGSTGGAAPAGSVSFYVCQVTSGSSCSSGGSLVGTVGSPSSSTGNQSTYSLGTTYTPTSVGTFCFYTAYTPTGTEPYLTASGPAECFWVHPHPHGPAPPAVATQQSASTSGSGTIVLGGSVTDTATVSGNSFDGAPTGTVTFTVCSTGSSPALCTSGTQVGTAPVALTPGSGLSSTATSVSFTPTAVGTYCFGAAYAPGAGSNYQPATDNMGPTVDANECFSVTAPPTSPNFTVAKSDTPGNGIAVAPGSTIHYTVAITNVGTATGSATVTDDVPSSETVQGTPGCVVTTPATDSCMVANPSGSTWTFTVTLAPGDTATATFAALVASTATGTITNTATITDGNCTTSSGCSSTVTNTVTPVTSPAVTVSTTPPAPVTAPATAPATAPVTTPATAPVTIAFTGARLEQEWLFGLGAALMGAAFIVIARLRRRPRVVGSKK
jgi:hypothetical protein